MSLMDTPLDVLHEILQFVDKEATFRAFEQSCTTLRNAYQTSGLTKEREHIRYKEAVQKISAYQHTVSNILVKNSSSTSSTSVLTVEQWHSLITCHTATTPLALESNVVLEFRGDTSFHLAEIVQATLLKRLEQANFLMMNLATSSSSLEQGTKQLWRYKSSKMIEKYKHSVFFPPLTGDHLEVLEMSLNPQGVGVLNDIQDENWRNVRNTCEDIDQLEIDKIVRRLAYRAGIVKLDDSIYHYVWSFIVTLLRKLLEPSLTLGRHLAGFKQNLGKKRQIRSLEEIRDVPPFPWECSSLFQSHFHFIPVPGMIVTAAQGLQIPHSIYGNEWHLYQDQELDATFDEAVENFYVVLPHAKSNVEHTDNTMLEGDELWNEEIDEDDEDDVDDDGFGSEGGDY